MTDSNRPNLFHYATSELSQDAFICWLAAWADSKWKDTDPTLHQTAREFVTSMIRKVKPDYDQAQIKTINVRRQVEKLDILIEINQGTDGRLAILVEDKTHTDHHSGQLKRYYDNAGKSYTSEQIVPIYFKTGYQSKFDVRQYKYEKYLRQDFLNLLRGNAKKVNNVIYADFLAHLESMESAVNQFSTKDLTVSEGELAWNDNDRRGLFMHLYDIFSKTDSKTNWSYVANPSGGFFGFHWNYEVHAQGNYWTYLQLEGDKLCYKIGFSDKVYEAIDWKEKAQKIKSIWSGILLKLDEESTAKHAKIGKTMTIAKKSDRARYLVPKVDGTLDLEKTIEKLHEAELILKKARQQFITYEQQ